MEPIRADEINEIIRKQIENFETGVTIMEVGTVIKVGDGIAEIHGLEKVMAARSSPEGFGIDINSGDPVDMWELGIIDPLLVKTMALKAAGEIAKSVLRIDRNLAAEDLSPQAVSETKR